MKNRPVSLVFAIVLAMFFSLAPCLSCLAMPPLDMRTIPEAPDYTVAEGWLVQPAAPLAQVDVFFVYPTVLFTDTDWIMDPARPEMRDAAMVSVATQASVFDGQANIYAPMYRQMNIAGLGLSDADAAPLKEIAHDDVWRALNHYLQHENNGRPFFLASHSQGSMILTDLLVDHWGTTGVEERLIAALLPGWSVTPADLAANPALRMCERANQTGCVISYNSMAKGRQTAAPTLKNGALAVNPLSWAMDAGFVPAEKNLGAVFFDAQGTPTTYPRFTSARIVDGGLIVQPENEDLVTVKGGLFPEGIYHAFDYGLFFENIRANMAERIEAFVHREEKRTN